MNWSLGVLEWLNSQISDLLTTTIKDFNSDLFNLVEVTYATTAKIAIVFLIILFTIDLGKASFQKSGNIEPMYFASMLIKLIFGIVFIQYGKEILNLIQIIGVSLTKAMSENNELGLVMDYNTLLEEYNSLSLWEQLGNQIQVYGIIFCNIVSIGIIYFISLGRLFELAILTAFAPIPLSTLLNSEFNDTGKRFIKSYIGVCIKSAIIKFILDSFNVISLNLETGLVEQAISTMILAGLIFGSTKFAEKIIG